MPETVRAVVENGGNVEIVDGRFSVDFIKSLLAIATRSGAQITIRASSYSTEVLLDLARLGGGQLTVKFE
ncbi:MAG TPA: hypothetical protein VJ743_19790 [Albitalea sp.]|nr:hypothetical protein [Albitalea sp.]